MNLISWPGLASLRQRNFVRPFEVATPAVTSGRSNSVLVHVHVLKQVYEHRGALRGTPGSAYPQPEPNATELPSSAPGRPLRRRTNYLEPQRLRPLRHAPDTSPDCRSCASAPSPAAPAGVREEQYSRNARSARNLGARNRDAAIVRCRCDDALGLPWCCSAHAC